MSREIFSMNGLKDSCLLISFSDFRETLHLICQGSTFQGAWGHMPLDFAVGP